MKLLDRAVVLVLAALVLISSTGLFVDRMDCRKSGKAYWALNTNLKSCSAVCDTPNPAVGDNCCDRFTDYFKDNIIPANVKVTALAIRSVAVVMPTDITSFFKPVSAIAGVLWSKAPPLPIRRHLALSVLLV